MLLMILMLGASMSSRDNHDVGVSAVAVISLVDIDVAVHEIDRVGHVQCFGIGLVLVDVDEGNFLGKPLIDDGIGSGASDIPAANNYYF